MDLNMEYIEDGFKIGMDEIYLYMKNIGIMGLKKGSIMNGIEMAN